MAKIALWGWSQNPWNFEADLLTEDELSREESPNAPAPYSLYILKATGTPHEVGSRLDRLLQRGMGAALTSSPLFQVLLVGIEPYSTKDLIEWTNHFPIAALIHSNEQHRVADLIQAIDLTQRLEEQSQVFLKLQRDEAKHQESQYQKLLADLNEHHRKIGEIQSRLLEGLRQEKILHDTLLLLATHHNLSDIETGLEEILTPFLGPLRIRVILHDSSTHPRTWEPPALSFILHERDRALGRMIVHSLEDQEFHKTDLKLLENISEALSLQIPRFLAFEDNKTLELEWRTTFNAISDPLLIVNQDYEVIEANEAALRRGLSPQIPKQKCYQWMFRREKPCDFCHWGQRSNRQSHSETPNELWEMSSHELERLSREKKTYIHLYRNQFEHLQMEQRISTFAQEAEVGIFRASLAHELNNPIGGLLTLAQLQKMDLPKTHPLYPVVSEIEALALQCRDLIQDLLQKARLKISDANSKKG